MTLPPPAIDLSPRPRSRRRPSLLTKVSVISLIVVVGIGVVVGLLLQQSVRDRAISDAARTGEVAANVGVRPFLQVADLDRNFMPLPPERIEALDASLGESLSPNGIVRIKLWNRQHWLVYSDNMLLRGRWFAGAEILERSFLGELTSEITDLTAPEEREERDFGELLAVYVPLYAADGEFTTNQNDEIVGAFEIYLPWAPIAADIRADTIKLWVTLAVSLLVLYVALFQLVSRASKQLQRKSEQNLYFATHDTLTGLANRDAFQAAISQQALSVPSTDETTVVLLFDLDDFQVVNDTLGHDVGDRLLQILAHRLRQLAGPRDTACRMGGDEFGLMMPNVAARDVEATVALHANVLNTTVELDGLRIDVSASVGVVLVSDDMSADEVLQRVDIAMYEAKRRRSGIEYFRPEIDTFTSDSLTLAGEIRDGIVRDEFMLHYQPKYSLTTGVVVGGEALLRWRHPTRGLVPPGSFIAMAEQLPIGRELTNYVLSRAVSDLAQWHACGLHIGVSVNLSARDVSDPQLASTIEALLDRHHVDGRWLTLELTESTILADEGRAIKTLNRLRQLDCGVAIDDFGTGYASISYLVRLPATELKIDRSFIEDLGTDQQSRHIVQHCVGLARSLGLSVTAEGIETTEVETLATGLGCDTGQGYLRGKPMETREFLAAVSTVVPAPAEPIAPISAEDACSTDKELELTGTGSP